jgi:hypothetical protein
VGVGVGDGVNDGVGDGVGVTVDVSDGVGVGEDAIKTKSRLCVVIAGDPADPVKFNA